MDEEKEGEKISSLIVARTTKALKKLRRRESQRTETHIKMEAVENSRKNMVLTFLFNYSARIRREVELPVHYPFAQHQRRWQAENHVRLDQDQGCWSSLLQLGLQKGRC